MDNEFDCVEKQLFDFDGWDGDHECMIYYDPTLKVQIGEHPIGSKFSQAIIMFDKGVLQLTKSGEMINGYAPIIWSEDYRLHLTVGELIKEQAFTV